MPLHAQLLLGFEPSLLAKDRIFDTNLADVVEDAGPANGTDLRLVTTERPGHDDGVLLDALGVAVGIRIAGLDRRRQRFDRHQVGVLKLHQGDLQ